MYRSPPRRETKNEVITRYFPVGLNVLTMEERFLITNVLVNMGMSESAYKDVISGIGLLSQQPLPEVSKVQVIRLFSHGDNAKIRSFIRLISNLLNDEANEPTVPVPRFKSPIHESGLNISGEFNRVLDTNLNWGYIFLSKYQLETVRRKLSENDAQILIAGVGLLSERNRLDLLLRDIIQAIDSGRTSRMEPYVPVVYNLLNEAVVHQEVDIEELDEETAEEYERRRREYEQRKREDILKVAEKLEEEDPLDEIIDQYYHIGAKDITSSDLRMLSEKLTNADLEVVVAGIGLIRTKNNPREMGFPREAIRNIRDDINTRGIINHFRQLLLGTLQPVKKHVTSNPLDVTGLGLIRYYG